MEYQYGTVEGYPPALTDVIDYLQIVWLAILIESVKSCVLGNDLLILGFQIQLSAESSDVQMRNIIYNMLSAEGSLKSQMVNISTTIILNYEMCTHL